MGEWQPRALISPGESVWLALALGCGNPYIATMRLGM
jgi:hypothetical protein